MQTFVVRLWTPADLGERFDLQGIVEDVASGERSRFDGPEELLAALQAWVHKPPTASAPHASALQGEPHPSG